MKPLDMRDIAIIDSFPVYDCQKKVLNVGCGEGRIDWWLAHMGYAVYSTDIEPPKQGAPVILTFHKSDIFDLSSFPIKSSPIVICSQVLEHLKGYKLALVHLLALTGVRLIITVPDKLSFFSSDHINFWGGIESENPLGNAPYQNFRDVHEFVDLCQPYSTSISKIRTKPEDVEMGQWNYLIVVDKRQNK